MQLAQHELRDDDDAVEEAGLGDVGDATVDDDAGVQDFVAALGLLLAAEDAAERGQVQQLAFTGADDQADVGHQQHDKQLQEALGRTRLNAVFDDQAEKISADDAEDAADDGADQPLQADLPQADLEQNHG